MQKTNITVAFDDEKLDALEVSLKKEGGSTTVQAWLEQTLAQLYEQTVPQPLREYLDRRTAPPRPKRPSRHAPKERPAAESHGKDGHDMNQPTSQTRG